MLSYLSSLRISVLRSLDTNKFYYRTNQLYDAALLTRFILSMLFVQSMILKLIIQNILSKSLLLIKE